MEIEEWVLSEPRDEWVLSDPEAVAHKEGAAERSELLPQRESLLAAAAAADAGSEHVSLPTALASRRPRSAARSLAHADASQQATRIDSMSFTSRDR